MASEVDVGCSSMHNIDWDWKDVLAYHSSFTLHWSSFPRYHTIFGLPAHWLRQLEPNPNSTRTSSIHLLSERSSPCTTGAWYGTSNPGLFLFIKTILALSFDSKFEAGITLDGSVHCWVSAFISFTYSNSRSAANKLGLAFIYFIGILRINLGVPGGAFSPFSLLRHHSTVWDVKLAIH